MNFISVRIFSQFIENVYLTAAFMTPLTFDNYGHAIVRSVYSYNTQGIYCPL